MKTIHCPNCDEAVPELANFCAVCGTPLSSAVQKTLHLSTEDAPTPEQEESTIVITAEPPPQEHDSDADHPILFNAPAVFPLLDKHTPPLPATVVRSATINTKRRRTGGLIATPTTPLPAEDWNTDSGALELDDPDRQLTWQKDIEPPTLDMEVSYPPRPSQPEVILLAPPRKTRRFAPSLFFWVSVVVLCLLTSGGLFGVSGTLGRGSLTAAQGNIALQVTPGDVSIGATMTLRGTNFTPRGHIGLTRDSSIQLTDTGGQRIIQADDQGNFSDTVVVGQDWGLGSHTIGAEDATTHKIASFPIRVGGQSAALRPAHLALSTTTLDLGAGDQASNSLKPITLMNLGSGQITWQASSTQAWLQLSPTGGTFSNGTGEQIMIAVNRANMKPGTYSGQVNFSSNAGNTELMVTMQVTQLQVDHQAVLQLSPAVMAFSAPDGSAAASPQMMTIGNPGVLPLGWSVSSNASWLSVSSPSGTVDASNNGQVKVQINTSMLLPGTYEGMITFSGPGNSTATQNSQSLGLLVLGGQNANAVLHSPQSVYVSVTITPHCGLEVSPGTLDFTAAYLQPAPPVKVISLSNTESCAAPVQWQAASNANWLNVSSSNGSTPDHPTIGINVADLNPGTYHSSISFNSSAGTQVLPITFTMGQPTTPILATGPASLYFTGSLGSGDTGGQSATITNTGGGILHWSATGISSTGSKWISISPSSGTLGAHSSASVTVTSLISNLQSAGTYNGTITITGVDDNGNAATGNSQRIPITLVVKAPCTVSSNADGLTFNAVAGNGNPDAQSINIHASGGCANALTWTTSVNHGWLNATSGGKASLSTDGTGDISVTTDGLGAGTYHGTVTINAADSVTHAAVGSQIQVPVTLNVQQACTMQGLSTSSESFAAEIGNNPAEQSFTVNVEGACSGHVLIAPNVSTSRGTGWLSVSPAPATIVTGGSATFTVHVNAAALGAGHYSGAISLVATNHGNTISNGTATVNISLDVQATPILSAGPPGITFNVTNGSSAQPITIKNTGGGPLNWTTTLINGPSFLSLSATEGTNLTAGNSTTVNATVNANGVQGGSYSASVLVKATDPATGQAISGSPISIPITINVTQAQLSISTGDVNLGSVQQGGTVVPKSLVITNAGGGTLAWTATQQKSSWLVVDSQMQGSIPSGGDATLTFGADTSNVSPGHHATRVTISSPGGQAQTVTIELTVTAPPVLPSPSPSPTGGTGSPVASPPTGSPTASPTASPTTSTLKSSTLSPLETQNNWREQRLLSY